MLRPAFKVGQVFGMNFAGRALNSEFVFLGSLVVFLLLLRVVNSLFGGVLQAIRENPFAAEAIGYRIGGHRTPATCIAAVAASVAGSLHAVWLQYVGPDTALNFSIQIDVLVVVVLGGMGTLYGVILGSALFVVAQNYLHDLMGMMSHVAAEAGVPLVPALLDPDRWLLWLG